MPRLALPSSSDDEDLALGQLHRLVEADRLGKIEQIARRPRNPQDSLQAPPGNAQFAPSFLGDLAQRLKSRGIGCEGRHQHPALRGFDRLQQSVMNRPLRTRRLLVEHIRGIANAYKHLYTKGNEYSEISSTGAIESVPLRHSSISEVFQDVDGGSETSYVVFYTTRAGVKKEFLPVLEVLVNYWRKKIDNEEDNREDNWGQALT